MFRFRPDFGVIEVDYAQFWLELSGIRMLKQDRRTKSGRGVQLVHIAC
jgi:hypothetical protein